MRARHVLGFLFLAVAALFAFSQTYLFFTLPPEFTRLYAVRLSLLSYGFALPAAIVGYFLIRGQARFWIWLALAIAVVGLWQFVVREIWLYYVVLPQTNSDFLTTHSYFTGPLWWSLVRLSWHAMLPVMVVMAAVLTFKSAPDKLPQPASAD
jgi:hypothetical protein